MDRGHSSLSDRIRLSAQHFDGLFGKPEDDEQLNQSRVLARFGLQKVESENPTPLLRLSSHIDLPKIKKRWKLLVNSTTESFFTKRLSGAGDPFRLGEAGENVNQVVTTALRWQVVRELHQSLDVDLGAKIRVSPQAYLKGSYLKRWMLRENLDMVFNQNVFGVINGDSGSSTSLNFNRSYGEDRLYCIHHRYTRIFAETFATWQVTHSLYQVISPRSTIAFHTSVSGDDEIGWRHQDVAFAVQYKRKVFRPWIWIFIEPEIHHPRKQNWQRTHQISVGLETLFGSL